MSDERIFQGLIGPDETNPQMQRLRTAVNAYVSFTRVIRKENPEFRPSEAIAALCAAAALLAEDHGQREDAQAIFAQWAKTLSNPMEPVRVPVATN